MVIYYVSIHQQKTGNLLIQKTTFMEIKKGQKKKSNKESDNSPLLFFYFAYSSKRHNPNTKNIHYELTELRVLHRYGNTLRLPRALLSPLRARHYAVSPRLFIPHG